MCDGDGEVCSSRYNVRVLDPIIKMSHKALLNPIVIHPHLEEIPLNDPDVKW